MFQSIGKPDGAPETWSMGAIKVLVLVIVLKSVFFLFHKFGQIGRFNQITQTKIYQGIRIRFVCKYPRFVFFFLSAFDWY